jgi:TolB-like protein
MAGSQKPFPAYRGDEPFIFVSYAHDDAESIYPDLRSLHEAGFNVYYDEGISPGSRWTTELAEAIERASLFVAFLSPSSVGSENCTNEVEFAVSRKRPILVVHVAETPLPSGLELSLGGRQALKKYELDPEAYYSRLTDAVGKLLEGRDPAILSSSRPRLSSSLLVLAAAALLVAGVAWFLNSGVDTEVIPSQSDLRLAIAVRPFDTSAADLEGEFFADGVADDLVMRLGHWRTLPVIARGTSFARDLPTDPVAAGQALDARYLVEGSVRSGAQGVKLAVFLVDAASGSSIWSGEYEPSAADALAVQSDIADAIVTRINPALLGAETERAVREDPATLDAWSAAMRGWWHLNQETQDGLDESQIWFARAAELDPTWSWPHSALALSAYRAIMNNWTSDARTTAGKLIESANRAVQLDARDAFAHHALGHAYAIQGQVEQSIGALARGVELSPNDPMANGCYAMQLAASVRPVQAQEAIDRAMSLSPEDPWQHRFALVKARAYFAPQSGRCFIRYRHPP